VEISVRDQPCSEKLNKITKASVKIEGMKPRFEQEYLSIECQLRSAVFEEFACFVVISKYQQYMF
jgi:hypothetical protein